MTEELLADARGVLREDFRLFHLNDRLGEPIEYHYHEFDKAVVFFSGEVTYLVEGRAYFLAPGDVLLVPHHHIHQPRIRPGVAYERAVLWLKPEWLAENGLTALFDPARAGEHLLRVESGQQAQWLRPLRELEDALHSREENSELLARTYCLQTLIFLARAFRGRLPVSGQSCRVDPKMEEVLRYINAHLEEDLSVEALSGAFYLSRSYLMHRFREATGCTIHQYVLQKRLIRAGELIRAGTPVLHAARECGFRDYSAFLRAFQRAYHMAPRDAR